MQTEYIFTKEQQFFLDFYKKQLAIIEEEYFNYSQRAFADRLLDNGATMREYLKDKRVVALESAISDMYVRARIRILIPINEIENLNTELQSKLNQLLKSPQN